MKTNLWAVLLTLCLLALWPSTLQAQNSLILSKDAGGTLIRNRLALTLRTNATCDQTAPLLPDGTQLLCEDLTFITDSNRLGVIYGSAQLVTPDGKVFQSLMLRGTAGMNVRRDADKDCRFDHLEVLLEPVPTFAPVNAPQIALAHLSADVIPEAAGPLPLYRAKLDGVVTLPRTGNLVTLRPDKSSYNASEPITAIINNNAQQAITALDLKSYCTIVKLQRQAGDRWVDVGQCFLRRAPFPVTLGAGETTRVVLMPNGNSSSAREPGVYRLVLEYTFGSSNPGTADQLTAVSSLFRVTNMPLRQAVSLAVDREPIYVGQTFVVSIINDTDLPIQTYDHKTHCTVLYLQRLGASGAWTNVAECPLASPTRPVTIGAHQSYPVKLPPEGAQSFPAGTYRVELSYQVVINNQAQGPNITIHTPEFAIRAKQ
jgi:hypothetical protein